MIYKDFGKTGKKISAIGFGGMRFLPEEYNKDIKICAELVLEAFERGITYFDTAPGYCDQLSEAIFGEAFSQMKYGKYQVSTKCGLWNATTADGVRKMIEQSLTRMKIPKITYYNLWCIKNTDEYAQMIAPGGIYDGILQAQKEGLIEHITCTTHANSADIAQVVADGKVEAVTISYNAVNFAYRRTGMAAAHDLGLGVVVMNPLGGGLIPQHPDRFAFLNENTGDSIAVAAMKFLLGHKEITCSLPGIATSAELNELMLSLENIPKVDDAYCNNLATKLSDEFDALCTSCQYCESCPVNIPITKFMDSYNGVLLGDGKSAAPAHNKLKYFWDVDHKLANGCTGCGICEELCTQKLPIADRMRHIGDFDPE